MLLKSLLMVILLMGVVDRGQGCSCLKAHKQEYYCRADFVLQVKVKAEEIIYRKTEIVHTDPKTYENKTEIERYPMSRKYTVRVKKVFKIKENQLGLTRNSSIATMYTSYYDATCGVQLQPNKKYITAGHFYDGQLSLDLCGWVEPWSGLSKGQKRNLKSLYETHCDCKVVNIQANGHWKRSKNEICDWDGFSDDGDCYDKHSACVHNKNSVLGECKWHRNTPLKTCRKEVKRRRWEP